MCLLIIKGSLALEVSRKQRKNQEKKREEPFGPREKEEKKKKILGAWSLIQKFGASWILTKFKILYKVI